MKLFSRTQPPENLAITTLPGPVSLLSWSDETRELLERWTSESASLPDPTLDYFGEGEYAYTLTYDAAGIDPTLRCGLLAMAEALYHLAPGSGLTLFDKLTDERITGAALRRLFAFLRALMVELTGDPLVAIYAPLGAAGRAEQGSFPLHADLYPPVFLLNVFDRVAKDGSGASVFLSMETALQIFDSTATFPPDVRDRFRHCVITPANADRYEEFYDLLHGPHPWTAEVERAMKAQRLKVRFSSGQGYLVHDRLWLHGRESPRGGVPKDRLHRFIFDTEQTRQLRIGAAQQARN